MLNAEQIKNMLTTEMILDLMNYLGGEIKSENDQFIIFNSICHSSDSSKLYFYPSTNSFNCWSQCGGVDIISIVQEVEGLDFKDAIKFIEDYFQLGVKKFGRPTYNINRKPREHKPKEIDLNERLPIYDEEVLNVFINHKPIEWLQEGVSEDVMDLFGIKFDLNSNGIIIPSRDDLGNLIGIRIRNLDEYSIDNYGKYTPFRDSVNDIMYKFPTSKVLYGLYENKEMIQKCKTSIIFEGEKSVLLSKTYFGENDISVGSYGCSLKDYQTHLLKSLGVEDIIFMYDREEDEKILKKIEKNYKKCSLLFNVYYVKDYEDLINIKDSPVDKGECVYRELLNKRIKYKLEINN